MWKIHWMTYGPIRYWRNTTTTAAATANQAGRPRAVWTAIKTAKSSPKSMARTIRDRLKRVSMAPPPTCLARKRGKNSLPPGACPVPVGVVRGPRPAEVYARGLPLGAAQVLLEVSFASRGIRFRLALRPTQAWSHLGPRVQDGLFPATGLLPDGTDEAGRKTVPKICNAGDQRFNPPWLPDRPISSTEWIERSRPFCSQLGTPCIAPKTVRAPV